MLDTPFHEITPSLIAGSAFDPDTEAAFDAFLAARPGDAALRVDIFISDLDGEVLIPEKILAPLQWPSDDSPEDPQAQHRQSLRDEEMLFARAALAWCRDDAAVFSALMALRDKAGADLDNRYVSLCRVPGFTLLAPEHIPSLLHDFRTEDTTRDGSGRLDALDHLVHIFVPPAQSAHDRRARSRGLDDAMPALRVGWASSLDGEEIGLARPFEGVPVAM